jgi:hypothetical protein
MKLEDTGMTSMDLNFEIPEAGISILQFTDGIQKRTNEKSGKTTLQLPMIIDKVVEGPEDNEGKKMSHFVPIETDFGEKQLAGILTMTGLMGQFGQKFGATADVTDDTFINAVKLKLPGKTIKAQHEVRKDNAGKDRVNIVRFEMVGSSGAKFTTKVQANGKGGGDDW